MPALRNLEKEREAGFFIQRGEKSRAGQKTTEARPKPRTTEKLVRPANGVPTSAPTAGDAGRR